MIIIIGGGITGLAAAYELTRRQAPFLLLEASDRLGGLIQTERVSGFTIDAGADSMLVQKPAAVHLCEEVGLGPRLMRTTPPRTAFVLKGDTLHGIPSPSVLGVPISASALLRYDLLNWRARARLALEPLMRRGTLSDESVASFFRRRFGDESVSLIAEPLLGGIHAGDIEHLSLPSLFPRLAEAEKQRGKVLINLARNRQPAPEGVFRGLRGGMGELIEAIQSRLPAASVRINTRVRSLHRGAASWRVATDAELLDGAGVIIAAPARAGAMLLAVVDPAAAQICQSVPYVSTASIALGFRRSDVAHSLAGSGFVVARRHTPVRITACTWVSSKWENRAPEGHVLLRAFVGGAHDPAAVDATDAELIDTALKDLKSVLGIAGAPAFARVYRSRDAGVQHNVGHRRRISGLRERLRSLPGVFVAGSGFESIGIPDCVAQGRTAAALAADYVTIRKSH
jgi:protoporphyrinogen/coproporphyrinogen III oxidase